MTLTYNPAVFDTDSVDMAKRIILTDEGLGTERRWQTETPYVADLIGRLIDLRPNSLLLDYGCGIGRMAKALIERYQCRIIGVDISEKMRAMASPHVGSEHFFACSPSAVATMVEHGLRFDAAISVWVLQHCLKPETDIELINRALKVGGDVFVLNNIHRAVPTAEKSWVHDGLQIRTLLSEKFAIWESGTLPPDKIAPAVARIHFWARFRKER
jgi:cyclopropane fatty-acyl-phospholipid synthase-like methyltransferase